MGLPLFISQILVSAIELSKDNSSARAQRAEILNLELGRLGSSATHVGRHNGTKPALMEVGLAVLFIVIVMFVLRPGMKWIVKRMPETGQIKDTCFYFVVLASMMSLRLNQELRMIDCIRVPGNVNSIISLLNACCPTCDSSIALDVLHLVKLNGGATPNSIAHRK
ncbi:hypothetical protein V6N12_060754 [Hibiscus sabdariffa]|uniref:Uncharacterized protein n=1 Tax=Hibiscus sabdariffa TaxID=183260 RepID=A0ABR2D5R9_9ROSI